MEERYYNETQKQSEKITVKVYVFQSFSKFFKFVMFVHKVNR